MEVHKPRLWRGWREFLKEYAIIVVGVLTALGAEQAVEWLHTQSEIAETQAVLLAEISQNATMARYIAAEEKCLFSVNLKYAAWANGGSRPRLKLTAARVGALETTVWDYSKSGAVTHMPLEEQLSLTRYYDFVRTFNNNNEVQRQAAFRMLQVASLDALNQDQAQRVIEGASLGEFLDTAQAAIAADLVKSALSLGAKPNPINPNMRRNLEQFCRDVGGPRPTI